MGTQASYQLLHQGGEGLAILPSMTEGQGAILSGTCANNDCCWGIKMQQPHPALKKQSPSILRALIVTQTPTPQPMSYGRSFTLKINPFDLLKKKQSCSYLFFCLIPTSSLLLLKAWPVFYINFLLWLSFISHNQFPTLPHDTKQSAMIRPALARPRSSCLGWDRAPLSLLLSSLKATLVTGYLTNLALPSLFWLTNQAKDLQSLSN